MSRLEIQSILSVCLLYIIRMLGLFMVTPVLALLESELLYATPLLIGLALGIYGLSQAVLQIPLGFLSDRIGRKPVILFGLLVFIAGSIVAGASESVYGVILGRCLQGVGAIASTLMALITDLTRLENRTTAMMMIGISIGGSFALSLVLGPYLGSLVGLSGIFYVTACLGVLGILILYAVVPAASLQQIQRAQHFQRHSQQQAQNALSAQAAPLESRRLAEKLAPLARNPRLFKLNLGIFLVHYLLMSGFLVFPRLLRLTGEVQDSQHYLIYLVAISLSFLLMGPFMWLSDRRSGTRLVLSGAIGLFILSFGMFTLETSLVYMIAGLFLFFMAFNLLEVTLPSQISRVAPARARGTAMGIYSTSQFAGAFVGGLVGGWIVQTWDMTYLLYVNMVICLFWLLLFFTLQTTEDIAGRTVYFDKGDTRSATELLEALSSVEGVEEVILVGEAQGSTGDGKVAYLKVDRQKFDDKLLATCAVAKIV